MTYEILLLCTGNTCRSPLAEVLLKDLLRDKLDSKPGCLIIRSAGTAAWPGHPASDDAIDAAAEIGLDLKQHRAVQATAELLEQAGLIITMTGVQKSDALALAPDTAGKIWTLGELVGEAGLQAFGDVKDPFGYPLGQYRQARDQIQKALQGITPYLTERIAQACK